MHASFAPDSPAPDDSSREHGSEARDSIDRLGDAFDAAAGLRSAVGVPPPLLAFARRIVAAGRRVYAAPAVPSAVLRRAADLGAGRAPRPEARATDRRVAVGIARWTMQFDSWGAGRPAPAMRGASPSRFLRYERDGACLDVEMVVGDGGTLGVRGTADGVPRAASLRLVPRRGRSVLVAVRAGGAFSAVLPAGSGPFTIEVRAGRRSLGVTPRIPPPAA